MPLTVKGKKLLKALRDAYGDEKGNQVFYAGINSGKFTGVERRGERKRK